MAAAAIDGASASLRPSGIGRYFGAAFLMIWLGGWALGEAFALGFLILLVRSVAGSVIGASWPIPNTDWIGGGAAGFVFLFLLIWLLLWTVGGVAAIHELLRNLAGEDRISVEMGGVEFERRAGPFRRTRKFDRSRIRRIRLRAHDKAVVIDTTSRTELITNYGTVEERRAMAEWLRSRLSLPEAGAAVDPVAAPPGWVMTVEGSTTHLTRTDPKTRRTASLIMWAIVVFMGLIWYGASGTWSAGSVIAAALTLLVTFGAAWVTWSRREWRVRHGELVKHTRFLSWEWERSFKSARLEVVKWTDSDNDDRYTLNVIDAQGKRQIATEINDEAETVDLARWLAARTGFTLTMPRL
jgi:membrane protein YdbS with pleckstrin-like domain